MMASQNNLPESHQEVKKLAEQLELKLAEKSRKLEMLDFEHHHVGEENANLWS